MEVKIPLVSSGTSSEWEIDSRLLTLDHQLGHGQFGRVFGGTWQGTPVALKVLYDTTVAKNRSLFVREVETMARLHHPNIVQFLGFATFVPEGGADAQLGIVMELFSHRSVEDYVARSSPTAARSIDMRTKRRFCLEMAMALTYLHNRRPCFLVHRDVKPSNFMLTNSLRVKLCDFGLSRLFEQQPDANAFAAASSPKQFQPPHGAAAQPSPLDDDYYVGDDASGGGGGEAGGLRRGRIGSGSSEVLASVGGVSSAVVAPPALSGSLAGCAHGAPLDLTANCGTVRFMAPEVAAEDERVTAKYTTSCDVFSLGLVYYFVFERVLPRIEGCGTPQTHLAALRAHKRPQYTTATPPAARALIGACWSTDASSRPRADELVEQWRQLEQRSAGWSACAASLLGGHQRSSR